MSGKQRPIDLQPVLDWICRNSTDGIGPSRILYKRFASSAGLPSASTLQLHRWTWSKLLDAAGVAQRPIGRPLQSHVLRPMPDAVEDEIERMRDRAEPPQPRSWPLFGIQTRQTVFIVQIDDRTAIRCIWTYYSLR